MDTADDPGNESPERLTFFSDAVAAIALTLLAVELPVPRGATNRALWHDLGAHWSDDYQPFLLSFVVIAVFWSTHHGLFRNVTRLGPGLVPLNFVFLLMIVLVPFVTRVLGEAGHDVQIGVVLYAATIAALAATIAAISQLVRRRGLARAGTEDRLRGLGRSMATTAVVFVVSIPVGFARPSIATWVWIGLAVALNLVSRFDQRRRRGRPAG